MARKRKPGAGRKPKAKKAVVIRLVLSLDPVDDADLIERFLMAPDRGKAPLAINLMRNGIPKRFEEQAKGFSGVVEIDDSEF